MRLPSGLQHWSAALGLIAPELRWPLAGLVQKLASVIGPLAVAHSAWDGEPDGFDGLDRRGPYERLLTSEWLLADEAPIEFIRRAAMSEHVFLRLARPEPSGDRLSIALFDAGPSQMGTPRLVHLALLVLLARRAEAARARFGWGIVQEPQAPLGSALDEAAVMRLLEARTAETATADHVAQWTRLTRDWPRMDECWWIGGGSLAAMVPGRASRVTVDDALEPGERRVLARVSIPGRIAATVPLDLPKDGQCARLVRDPFGTAAVLVKPTTTKLRPTSNLLLSADGRKVYARLAGRGLASYPIPNSPREPIGRPKTYETYGTVAAACRDGRSLVTAVVARDGIVIRTFGKASGAPRAGRYPDESGTFRPPEILQPLWLRVDRGGAVKGHLVDDNGALFALVDQAGQLRLSRVTGTVLAAVWWKGALLVAERVVGEGVWLSRVHETLSRLTLLADEAERVLFALTTKNAPVDPGLGPLAFNPRGREWSVRMPSCRSLLIAPESTTVLGLAMHGGDPDAGLVVLEADRRTFTVLGRNWGRELGRASSPVEHAVVDSALGLLAYATGSEIAVVRLETGTAVLRIGLA